MEWQHLRGSNELTALESFISRYREKPTAIEARNHFRRVVAGLENAEVLRKFVRETMNDSPERTLAKRQLALLVERETTEDDRRAWDETRTRGSAAALRAYIESFPNGMYVAKAEERLAAIEDEAISRKKEAAAWAKAVRAATIAGYEAYLKAEPDGRHADDARKKIASIAATETQASIEQVEPVRQPSPPRIAAETPRIGQRSGSRFPSPDEPFIDRIQGPAQ